MITGDENTLLQHHVKNYTKIIEGYINTQLDNMAARNIFAQRNVGADTMIDVVTTYDDSVTNGEAQVVAKGAAPLLSGMSASSVNHDMYQIADAFNINAKDLKLDPKLKTRQINLIMQHVHRTEDNLALNGSAKYGITGLTGAAAANSNGTITTATNKGAWSGEAGTDIYDDLVTAKGLMDSKFKPAMLVGNRDDLNYLLRMDSERQPYFTTLSGLFGKKNPMDNSWMVETDQITAGTVYMIPKDMMAAEFVVSENPRIVTYEKSAGENYRVEILSWSAPEFHENDAFVSVATG